MLRLIPGGGRGGGEADGPFARSERRTIFREMVRGELRDGHLSATRRHRLIRYAAKLKLSAVEAGELVSQVQREYSPIPREPILDDAAESETLDRLRLTRRRWWLCMSAAILLMAAIQLLIPR